VPLEPAHLPFRKLEVGRHFDAFECNRRRASSFHPHAVNKFNANLT
jgi:hypothetical protein